MSRPTWARWVTRISLIIALVALAITIRNTGVGTIVRYFRRIGWWWFAVLALEVAITSLDAVAIRAFCSPEQGLVKLRSALLSQLAGRSVNAGSMWSWSPVGRRRSMMWPRQWARRPERWSST